MNNSPVIVAADADAIEVHLSAINDAANNLALCGLVVLAGQVEAARNYFAASASSPAGEVEHPIEDRFQHFLAYSGIPESSAVRYAYYHGADADECKSWVYPVESDEPTPGDGLLPCPKCGAPCKATVHAPSGRWGWGTSDRERTTYAHAQQHRAGVDETLLHELDEYLEGFCPEPLKSPKNGFAKAPRLLQRCRAAIAGAKS